MLYKAEKFPGQTGKGIPPSPTIENPGQVYPKTDLQAPHSTVAESFNLQSVTANPCLFENGLRKLDMSLSDLISILEDEAASNGNSNKGVRYLEKLRGWKSELFKMRNPHSRFNLTSEGGGEYRSPNEEGGLFVE